MKNTSIIPGTVMDAGHFTRPEQNKTTKKRAFLVNRRGPGTLTYLYQGVPVSHYPVMQAFDALEPHFALFCVAYTRVEL